MNRRTIYGNVYYWWYRPYIGRATSSNLTSTSAPDHLHRDYVSVVMATHFHKEGIAAEEETGCLLL